MTGLLVAARAVVGTPTRYATDVPVTRTTGARFPFGTLAVNVVASFGLGLVTGGGLNHGLSSSWRALLATGLCGTLSTYSTFSQESVGLLAAGRPRAAALDLLGSAAIGLGAAGLGLWLALA